jgi:putative flippase GtrA
VKTHGRQARAKVTAPMLTRLDSLPYARFVKFLLVGGLNTLFGYAVFLLALALTGRSILSLAIAWTLGVLFNFRTTGRLVFRASDSRLLARFIAAQIFVFCVNAAALRALEWVGLASALAAALLTPLIAAVSYLLMRDVVFSAAKSEMDSQGHTA